VVANASGREWDFKAAVTKRFERRSRSVCTDLIFEEGTGNLRIGYTVNSSYANTPRFLANPQSATIEDAGAYSGSQSDLFNSSLEGNTRRAIDIHEGEKMDEKALQALIRAAVPRNTSSPAKRQGKRA
jgi:hypothetical protein